MPPSLLFQPVGERAALLNLDTETYYELDEIGTAMWEALSSAPTIGDAAALLSERFDAPVERISADLVALVAELRAEQLLTVIE